MQPVLRVRISIAIPLALAVAAAACGEQTQRIPSPYPPGYAAYILSGDEQDQRSAEYGREARTRESKLIRSFNGYPPEIGCPDQVLNDQLRAGFDVPLTTFLPCTYFWGEFMSQRRASNAHKGAAQAARSYRALAGRLVRAEVAACTGISDQDRAESVFGHREDIAHIIPHYEAGALRGVWVVFRPVQGLTADWVRRAIACQSARSAVLGGEVASQAIDPTLVPGTHVQVLQRRDHVEVLVTTPMPVDAELALARAETAAAQPPAQTATR
jgi:hypothetical protein